MEDRLQKFAALVDAETFTKAASVLHISQPALTAAVQKLERELGVELLVRTGNRFQLTSAGRMAYMEGKELGARRQNLKLQVANLKHEKIPLAIGMIDSVANALFANTGVLRSLENTAQVSLSVNNSTVLREAVASGRLDLAITVEQNTELLKNLETVRLGAEPLVFVAHSNALQAVKTAVSQGKLPSFLSYNQESATYRLIRHVLEASNVSPEVKFYSTSPEIILKIVLEQQGVAALPHLLVREHIASGQLVPVFLGDSCLAQRNISVIKARKRIFPPALEELLAQISNSLQSQNTEAKSYKK